MLLPGLLLLLPALVGAVFFGLASQLFFVGGARAEGITLLALLPEIQLTLVIGRYAMRWHLPEAPSGVTDAVQDFAD